MHGTCCRAADSGELAGLVPERLPPLMRGAPSCAPAGDGMPAPNGGKRARGQAEGGGGGERSGCPAWGAHGPCAAVRHDSLAHHGAACPQVFGTVDGGRQTWGLGWCGSICAPAQGSPAFGIAQVRCCLLLH